MRVFLTGRYFIASTNIFNWVSLIREHLKHAFDDMWCHTSYICKADINRESSMFLRENGEGGVVLILGSHTGTASSDCPQTISVFKIGSGTASHPESGYRLKSNLFTKTQKACANFQKSISLLMGLIFQYSPSPVGGTVIRSFARTCTTGISIVHCNRYAIMVKGGKPFFWLATRKMKILADTCINHKAGPTVNDLSLKHVIQMWQIWVLWKKF